MKFTEALDDYLEAKKVYDEVRGSYEGYDFEYHFYSQSKKFNDAKNVLNDLFETGGLS